MVLLQKWQVTEACLCGLKDTSSLLRWLSNTALRGRGEGLNQSHDYHIALWGGGEGLNQSHDYHIALWGGGEGLNQSHDYLRA